jgi:hypothetical protein
LAVLDASAEMLAAIHDLVILRDEATLAPVLA